MEEAERHLAVSCHAGRPSLTVGGPAWERRGGGIPGEPSGISMERLACANLWEALRRPCATEVYTGACPSERLCLLGVSCCECESHSYARQTSGPHVLWVTSVALSCTPSELYLLVKEAKKMREDSHARATLEATTEPIRVRVRVRVKVKVRVRVRVRVRGGDYFLRLHTPFSIVGLA